MFSQNIVIKNESIPLIIKKSPNRKRSLSFRISEKGLIISAPIRTGENQISKILTTKYDWIHKNWLKQKDIENILKKNINSESFYFKGEILNINSIENKKITLVEWLKNEANIFLVSETLKLAKTFNFNLENIYIKNYKSKYGQCRGRDVYFNYKMIKLPISLIKHIILHELCHLKNKNHSKKFWDLVKITDPDFLENKKFLKNGASYILNS